MFLFEESKGQGGDNMTRSYTQMMVRHIIRIVICFPLTLFGLVILLVGIAFLFEDFFMGITTLVIGGFMAFFLGKTLVKSVMGIFTEGSKKINYKDVYIVESREISFHAGQAHYSLYVATNNEGIHYSIPSDFNKYFHQNGQGVYTIGIQEDAKFISRRMSGGNRMDLLEIYSVEKIN